MSVRPRLSLRPDWADVLCAVTCGFMAPAAGLPSPDLENLMRHELLDLEVHERRTTVVSLEDATDRTQYGDGSGVLYRPATVVITYTRTHPNPWKTAVLLRGFKLNSNGKPGKREHHEDVWRRDEEWIERIVAHYHPDAETAATS